MKKQSFNARSHQQLTEIRVNLNTQSTDSLQTPPPPKYKSISFAAADQLQDNDTKPTTNHKTTLMQRAHSPSSISNQVTPMAVVIQQDTTFPAS